MKLTIGYSTLANRLAHFIDPPSHLDWENLIIVQGLADDSSENFRLSELAKRDDLRSVFIPSVGVAKSRNQAIALAVGEYLVFGDDDITFSTAGLQQIIEYLDENPGCTLALAQATDETGALRKQYPSKITRLNLFNSARAATYEMVVRTASIRSSGILFDENFGAGAENYLGDEYIFIADLVRNGLRCDFVPITIASHPADSSGSRWGEAKDRISRAKIFTRIFGPFAPVVRFAFGFRRRKLLGSTRNLLLFTLGR
jgi:glycosyltransferase involved in cell wall biosynthesis